MNAIRACVMCSVVALVAGLAPVFGQTQSAADTAVEARVDAMLAKMSVQQKLQMLGGHDGFYVHDQPSIGLPALKMADGPVGVRNGGPSTAYPAGIALAATFDAGLAFEEGSALGHDSRARGVHFLLGPGVNIYRAPVNGRNFEYFGEDPYLAARMAVAYIEGLQKQGVSATVKHFALNNEEYDRHHVDSVVDERTLHEIYLPAFEAAVKEAHVGAIMDSYNLVNGVHASQSKLLNVEIAKRDWDFRGVIMSDWYSVYSGVGAANGGLDIEMPAAKFMNEKTLGDALTAGTFSQVLLDDKVRRILRLAVRMGWLDRPQVVDAPKDDPASRAVAHKVALGSITLLKNKDNLLPLDPKAVCTLAIIGSNAEQPVTGGGGSSKVSPIAAQSIVQAFKAALPARTGCPGVVFARGLPKADEIFRGAVFTHGIAEELFTTPQAGTDPKSTRTRDHLIPAAEASKDPSGIHSGRWVADYTPKIAGPVLLFIASGTRDTVTLTVNGQKVLSLVQPEGRPLASTRVDADPQHPLHLELTAHLSTSADGIGLGVMPASAIVTEEAKALAAKADVVLVTAGYDPRTEGEGFDRSFALPGGQEELIREVTARNQHVIVTLNAGGGVDTEAWLDRVPALMHLWYPGEEGAPALAELVFGKANPEGHLPISFERRGADNPTHDSYYPTSGAGTDHPQIKLTEGVFLGYRYYAGATVKPLYPFGYGLSYTSFAFSRLHVANSQEGVTVDFDVKNTGARGGADAVQVYVGDPSATVKRPVEELKAFRKVRLGAGESTHVTFTLDRSAFAYWRDVRHRWTVDPGKFTIMVGDSSANLPLSADLELDASSKGAPVVGTAPVASTPSLYNGTKEYSITVNSTRLTHSDGKENWAAAQANPTRVVEQLAGFDPKAVPLDKFGGRMDRSQPATGYFYTKKVGDRWWIVDPEGHEYFHQALVELSPGASDKAHAAEKRLFGDDADWMAKTHALLLQQGFDGAGAWSNAELIRHSALQTAHPLAYTINLDVMAQYGKVHGGLRDVPGHKGYPADAIFAFDPDFVTFADKYVQKIVQYKDDPNLFGYFSDNEMPIDRMNLDGYLTLPHKDPGYLAAKQFLEAHHAGSPNDDLRKEFLAIEMEHYFSVVAGAIRKYDPHHMYIGCRMTGKSKEYPEVLRVLGKYADIVSINYYNVWTPDRKLMEMWEHNSGKPSMITEWYTKGADSSMPNKTGAGWLVRTQAERGLFYQNFALALIESKVCVGWHWFKYQDNDPSNTHAELSNIDANKGIVNTEYQVYGPLVDRMRQLNKNSYALADYFDARAH